MSEIQRTYIPAAGHDWLLPLYDPLTALMGTASVHRQLVEQADLRPGQRVLEVGCGTGSLTTLVKALHPAVEVVGLDPDPNALERARHKATRKGVSIVLEQGFSDDLHHPDDAFDRVLSALMFHHLGRDEKARCMQEIRRVLRPGGSLHLVDLGGHDPSDGFLARVLHRSEHTRDNSVDAIVGFMRDAGFAEPTDVGQRRTLFGRVVYYRATKAT